MTGNQDNANPPEEPRRRGNLFLLEICFLGFIGVIVAVAFSKALGYKLVSSRTPFVIMVPLAILIVVHGLRLWRVRQGFNPRARLSEALSGRNPTLNKVLGFCGWMVGMVLMVLVLGHFAGVFLFCLILMRLLAGEPWGLSLSVAAGVTLFLFGVFEYAFNIDLFRGLIVRYFLGFRDF